MRHAYGRRPPKNAPALRFAAIRRAVPTYPASFDSIAGVSGWQMLGNDTYGDCVAVTWATVRRIVTLLAGTEDYPGIDEVLAVYRTQNPNFDPNSATHGPGSRDDGGMDIQTLLELLIKQPGPDGVKAVAFAKVDHTNPDEMKAALATFKFLWLGVNVTDDDEREFPSQPWTLSGRLLGGHSITATGYDAKRYLMQTWADEGSLSTAYVEDPRSRGVEEAWVVLWPEHAAHMTADQRAAFDQAFFDLTGNHVTWPTPAPTPVPAPPPLPPGPVDPTAPVVPQALADALNRFTVTKSCPDYLRTAWVDTKEK